MADSDQEKDADSYGDWRERKRVLRRGGGGLDVVEYRATLTQTQLMNSPDFIRIPKKDKNINYSCHSLNLSFTAFLITVTLTYFLNFLFIPN